ncbi:dihydroneopterin aldolase [Dinoroseobacter sp. PD6]|uniref:dihydroneopterin aldolase n=1 Tax=Dinoroseobacter sp. PD6 TaxID=3028384 RepID=UPI00237BE956|nr:dihydroneopterin aldolase [Dinoroseobacter sp. PD6]MDD9716350.1 dihydroneopterin aldolase [Dinoroseobacter sp. PD6]
MNDETRRAFAHPEARALHLSRDGRDRISLRDYVLEVEIGAFQAERGTRQRVRFNVVVEVRTAAETLADDVDKILSYDTLTEAIHGALAEERINLLETLAERVADRILSDPKAARAFVRIEKLDRGPFALGVEIVRTPEEAQRIASPVPRPRLVRVHAAAIAAPDLSARLDALETDGVPVILCIAEIAREGPRAAHPAAQRRIDLLALEQTAWMLAGRDPRCVVVDSRTEIDWALRQGQMTVWAPGKMLLDATDGPVPEPRDTEGQAAWLAARLDALEVRGLDL